jgi:hypothetical protein
MTMRSKYVKDMNTIKVDDELKQSIIRKIGSSSTLPQIRVGSFRSKVAMISVACVIVFLLIIGGPLILHNGDQTNVGPSALFNGFVITAYAADSTPLMVKPDVDFPLGKYSMFMSSVPGFPVTIVSKDADQISLRTSEGELLLWNPTDSKVINQGKEAIVKSGDTIYWSPLADGQVTTESMLEITAYKDKKKLGSNVIQIKSEDHVMYKGKVTND